MNQVPVSTFIPNHLSQRCNVQSAVGWFVDGLIYPRPEKQGREYYLTQDARYVGKQGPTLLEGINNGQAPQHS